MTRHTKMNWVIVAAISVLASIQVTAAHAADRSAIQRAKTRLPDVATPGGLVVHLGCGSGERTLALGAGENTLVHGLDTDKACVAQARKFIRAEGKYGKVSVDRFDGEQLPYVDNLINLIVADKPDSVPHSEMLRVLAPGGKALLHNGSTWITLHKLRPAELDEWTHYLHGPDGNPVSQDQVVGPPARFQWIAGPTWMRSHESDSSVKAAVAAQGRFFTIEDEAPASLLGPHDIPDKWVLKARDAFNGAELWKRPIKDWGWRAWKPSWFTPRPGGIPLNCAKRLVAEGDRVYVTLGYRAPVTAHNARTGERLRTFRGTERTGEILYLNGTLILTCLQGDHAVVKAVNAGTGQERWTSENRYRGTTTDYYRFSAMHGSVPAAKVDPTLNTATDGKVIALLDGADVVGLDFKTGRQLWRTTFPLAQADHNAGNIKAQNRLWTGTLIVKDGVVVHASPNRMAGLSAETGEILWSQPKKYLQHLWFEWKDVFVIDGLVWTWSAELTREALAGSQQKSAWPTNVNGYDLQTGVLKKSVPLGKIFKTHHHHRCYRNKATSRYILASRRGTEFVDLEQGQHTVHNWVRGICHLGMMPAYGLQYAPPHPCVCYINEKLNGFVALASKRSVNSEVRRVKEEDRLVRGPAYNTLHPSPFTPHPSSGWPMYRCDAARSGAVQTQLGAKPELLWERHLGEKLTQPVIANHSVFVSLKDAHHVIALDAADGQTRWAFAAGARIDSPPTYHQGTLVFGSADGWVYCVRASDGELVWRFQAAPWDQRMGAFGQLESVWPVHGSVLVMDDTAYFVAGRSSQLDGGLILYGLDAGTGRCLHRTQLQGPYYDVSNIEQNYQLPMGTLPDILQSDGKLIHMRETTFNRQLEQQAIRPRQAGQRVYAKGGLLDASYFKRAPWSLGNKGAYARLLVHDEDAAYRVQMFDTLRGLDPNVYFIPGAKGYRVFATDKSTGKPIWSKYIRVRVHAMAVAADALCVAGPPDRVDPKDPLASFEGRSGGVLAAFDKTNGKPLWQHELSAPPVWDGLAVASKQVYVALQNGHMICFDGSVKEPAYRSASP